MCCQGKKVSRFSIFPENRFSDEEVKKRLEQFYGEKKGAVGLEQLPFVLEKLASLSEFVREIKVNFTRFYYKRHGRRGFIVNMSMRSGRLSMRMSGV